MSDLTPFFPVWEEVQVQTKSGAARRADVVLVEEKLRARFGVAIEIKSSSPLQPKNYRDTMLQALEYVDAKTMDKRFAECPIKFAMVLQARIRLRPNLGAGDIITLENIESATMDGIELSFNSLRVGHVTRSREDISFNLAHNRLWSSRELWSAELQRRFPELLDERRASSTR